MTTQPQAVRRSNPPRPISTAFWVALGVAALAGPGCKPDVPTEVAPPFLELEFDPSTSPPKSYEPTILTTNAETQLLDFAVAGIMIPADPAECQTQTALPVAACEFYWYLQQLDGYPTLTPGRTPVSAPVDLATVRLPENLFIYEFIHGQSPLTDVSVTYDADAGYLTFQPTAGWDLGGLYFVAIRGYADGIKDVEGNEAVKSIIYALLQQDNSITCGATTADEIHENCAFYSLFAGDARFSTLPPTQRKATIAATLLELEQLRQLYKGELAGGLPFNVWDVVEEQGQMPPADVGVLWAFRTHTNSVVELNPLAGLAPVATSTTEIHLTAKGPIQADTLKPFALGEPTGTVFLLDATAFLGGSMAAALPAFTATTVGDDIVFTSAAPLVDGHLYMVLLTNEVEGKPGVPIVPSPVTVFLRTRGALVDDVAACPAAVAPTCPPTAPVTEPTTAKSLVPGLKGAEACLLEDGRQQFTALLDNSLVIGLTKHAGRPDGLTREIVAYMYGFQYCAQ
jgi:hypothetical protein